MDIRPLTDGYAVSPQINPADIAAIKAAGYRVIVCNRPDGEAPAGETAADVRAAAEAEGLTFIDNPFVPGALDMTLIETQGRAIDTATGPILAYCASGNRSSVLWALSQAGKVDIETLISVPARYGYQLEPLRPQIAAMAARRG